MENGLQQGGKEKGKKIKEKTFSILGMQRRRVVSGKKQQQQQQSERNKRVGPKEAKAAENGSERDGLK